MQNNHSKGDLRLRQCVEELILARNIRRFEDLDQKILDQLRMPVAEIKAIIQKVWIKESDPYTKQIDKWMAGEDSFDPAPGSAAGWFEPKDLLYRDMRVIGYKSGAFFVQSAIELWHVTFRHLSPRTRTDPNCVWSLCPSIITAPTRYFVRCRNAQLGQNYFAELDVSSEAEWRKRKTVTGAISLSAADLLVVKTKKEILEIEKPLIELISSYI
jgi:hypothetical protein